MNPSALFIRRPVATCLLMIGLLVAGFMGYSQLAISDMPNMEMPFIMTVASMPGASPETMANSVAKPLESAFSSISGLDMMNSTNRQGVTVVALQFDFDKDIDSAALDVQAAIDTAYNRMPDAMTMQPFYFKLNPDSLPVIQMALTSETLTPQELTQYAETYLAQQFSMISGVAQVEVRGAKRFAIRVQLDPNRMLARNVGIDEITMAISAANPSMPTGILQGESRLYNIEASGEISTVEEFSNIIVSWRGGAPIRLADVANVVAGSEITTQASWANDEEGIILQVTRQPGANTVQVTDDIKSTLIEIEDSLPPSINVAIVYDSSNFIQDSVHEVEFTLLLVTFLVILIIFFFLKSAMATIIPSLALPICILTSFGFMFLAGFTLNNVSLMSVLLVIGLVVDDAIVMLENIVRHREMGKSALDAALDGSKEVSFTILSMTLSLIAVFLPLLFMPGMIGLIFYEFGAVIVIALSVSYFVAITLTPMMARFFLPNTSLHGGTKFLPLVLFDKGFKTFARAYEKSLHIAMRHKLSVFIASLGLIVAAGFFASIVPTAFFPDMDGGNISITVKAEESISFKALSEAQKSLHPIILADPDVDTVTSVVGGGAMGETNTGSIFVRLKPHEERDPINTVVERLREALSHHPTVDVFVGNADSMTAGGSGGGAAYKYSLVGSDSKILYPAALALENALKQIPEVRDVASNLQLLNPTLHLEIDRDKATRLGITPEQIERTLYYTFGSPTVSSIYTDVSDYKVIMELLPEMQYDTDVLGSLYLRSSSGALVPMDTFVTTTYKATPLTIFHTGQFPSVAVGFNVAEGYSLGQAVEAVEAIAGNILPLDITGSMTGGAEDFQESMSVMIILLFGAVLLIYIILGILYESFIHPITILSGLPSAIFGGIFALWLFGSQLDMLAMMGILILIGIVKKNAIMVLDFSLEAERTQNLKPEDAVIQACMVRLRPILMTTLAAVAGAIPLALGFGNTGGELRQSIGIVIAGGLVFSQVVTLYITPVYYIYLGRFGRRVKCIAYRLFRKTLAE